MNNTGLYLLILLDEIFDNNGYLKKEYISLRKNCSFQKIERKLVTMHAWVHCDVVGISAYERRLKDLMKDKEKEK